MKTITKKLTCKKCGSEDVYFQVEGTFKAIMKPFSTDIEDEKVTDLKKVGSFCNNCGAENVIDLEIEVELSVGTTYKEAYDYLQSLKDVNGLLYYANFNGNRITSDMTLDEVSKTITGKTYEENELEKKDNSRLWELKRAEWVLKRVRNISDLIEESEDIITKEKSEEWKTIINNNAKDEYGFFILKESLGLLKMIKENKTNQEIKEEFLSQDHSGFSASVVLSILEEFSDRGKELCNFIENK